MENNKQSLYTKYRPNNFDQVIGQDVAKNILINSISKNKINHAYLFFGIRGTGKTTLARIFAKAVNCESRNNHNPCNKCETCKSINNGSAFDIIEIDAASNNGVDEIRTLKENSSYLTTVTKYKVYIIDEVHMLTKAAFNALLKILEEPPENTIFLLATTDIKKIPKTVLSRTIIINLEVISDEDIKKGVKVVIEGEGFKYDEDVLNYITMVAGGSLRDAISFLETSLLYSEELSVENVVKALGLIKIEDISDMLLNNPSKLIDKINNSDKDPYKISLIMMEVIEGFIEKGETKYIDLLNNVINISNTIRDPSLLKAAIKSSIYSIINNNDINQSSVSYETIDNNKNQNKNLNNDIKNNVSRETMNNNLNKDLDNQNVGNIKNEQSINNNSNQNNVSHKTIDNIQNEDLINQNFSNTENNRELINNNDSNQNDVSRETMNNSNKDLDNQNAANIKNEQLININDNSNQNSISHETIDNIQNEDLINQNFSNTENNKELINNNDFNQNDVSRETMNNNINKDLDNQNVANIKNEQPINNNYNQNNVSRETINNNKNNSYLTLDIITDYVDANNYMYIIKNNDKDELSKIERVWKFIENYITSYKYKEIVSSLLKTTPLATTDKAIIIGFLNEQQIKEFKRISLTTPLFNFLKEIIGDYKFLLPINSETWSKLLLVKDKIKLKDGQTDINLNINDYIDSEAKIIKNKMEDLFGEENISNE